MQTASTSYDAIMKNTNAALPHRFAGKWIPSKISETYYDVSPAGGINASVSDMARWLLALTADPPTVLKKETEDEIFHPFVRATSRNYNFRRWKPIKSAFYALGWRVLNFKNDTLEYHGGYVNGFRSEVAIDRKDKLAICVLVNAPGQLADLSIPKFFEFFSKRRDAIQGWEKRDNQVVAIR
jgi:beta-lactamase class C